MNTNNLHPIYLSRYEAANHLKVSTRTIDRLIRDNRIKAFKLGKRVLIYYDSLTEENINAIKPKFQNNTN
jgi:excisionase family DNA binding protein